ncbi:MAG: TIGR00296 family protein [Candidatus Odinarchaeum yellowstonii]|uniref:Protein OdinLCB4_003125 n=1 Tax=Odinarchaeota yellowstonii (strain LCB_4) TaxID=1841599 RepID=A0AAF0IC01_ODILC|nr:MAG: TIGR00296 family protein [Candidatus Odinarchaeum yellowstonii]
MSLTLDEGRFLIRIARDAIKEYVSTKKELKPPSQLSKILAEKRGVFVTLYNISTGDKQLRGCIGFPYPYLPLVEATIKAAISAATKDYRFFPPYGPGPVTLKELAEIIIEVSVLTKPELLTVKTPREYPKLVTIGKDGLIVESGMFSGLLLPQVAVEYGWSPEEFLSHCCQKAGLLADCWLDERTKIYKFQAQIFTEKTPGGEVFSEEASSTCG